MGSNSESDLSMFEQAVYCSLSATEKEIQQKISEYFESIKNNVDGWIFLLDISVLERDDSVRLVALQLLSRTILSWNQEQKKKLVIVYEKILIEIKKKRKGLDSCFTNCLVRVFVLSFEVMQTEQLKQDILLLLADKETEKLFFKICKTSSEEYDASTENMQKTDHMKRMKEELFPVFIFSVLSFMNETKQTEQIKDCFKAIQSLLPFVDIYLLAEELIEKTLRFCADPTVFPDAYECLCSILGKKTNVERKIELIKRINVLGMVEGYFQADQNTRNLLLRILTVSFCSFGEIKKQKNESEKILLFLRSFYETIFIITNESVFEFLEIIPLLLFMIDVIVLSIAEDDDKIFLRKIVRSILKRVEMNEDLIEYKENSGHDHREDILSIVRKCSNVLKETKDFYHEQIQEGLKSDKKRLFEASLFLLINYPLIFNQKNIFLSDTKFLDTALSVIFIERKQPALFFECVSVFVQRGICSINIEAFRKIFSLFFSETGVYGSSSETWSSFLKAIKTEEDIIQKHRKELICGLLPVLKLDDVYSYQDKDEETPIYVKRQFLFEAFGFLVGGHSGNLSELEIEPFLEEIKEKASFKIGEKEAYSALMAVGGIAKGFSESCGNKKKSYLLDFFCQMINNLIRTVPIHGDLYRVHVLSFLLKRIYWIEHDLVFSLLTVFMDITIKTEDIRQLFHVLPVLNTFMNICQTASFETVCRDSLEVSLRANIFFSSKQEGDDEKKSYNELIRLYLSYIQSLLQTRILFRNKDLLPVVFLNIKLLLPEYFEEKSSSQSLGKFIKKLLSDIPSSQLTLFFSYLKEEFLPLCVNLIVSKRIIQTNISFLETFSILYNIHLKYFDVFPSFIEKTLLQPFSEEVCQSFLCTEKESFKKMLLIFKKLCF